MNTKKLTSVLRSDLLKNNEIETVPEIKPAALSLEERNKAKALTRVPSLLNDMSKILEEQLSRVLNDSEIIIDLSLCNGSGLDQWYSEDSRMKVSSELVLPSSVKAYFAIDFQNVHQLACISFGGEVSAIPEEDITELTPSEIRVGHRVANTQFGALQKLLCPTGSLIPAQEEKQMPKLNSFNYLTFKVRASFKEEVISWFIWLPVELISFTEENKKETDLSPVLEKNAWQKIPVKCVIEMATRKASIAQLIQFTNGYLLPIELRESTDLCLNNNSLFKGKVLEDDTHLHFKVEQVMHKDS